MLSRDRPPQPQFRALRGEGNASGVVEDSSIRRARSAFLLRVLRKKVY